MTLPCESKEDIEEMKKAISAINNSGNKLEDALIRMAQAHEKQAAEIREMTQTVTAHMMDNREFRLSLDRAREERDVLFTRVRELEEGDIQLTAITHNHELKIQHIQDTWLERWDIIKPVPEKIVSLQKFQNRMTGGMILVPGLFTFLSLVMVWYSNFGGG